MRFSKAVVRGRVAILILTVILMIPAVSKALTQVKMQANE